VTYLQEFIPHGGWDLRILVVGDDTFAMRRVAAAGEWRTNVSLGGRPEAVEVPAEVIAIARHAACEIELPTNRTDPSMNSVFTPSGW
jgi:glutathione synthase/RimK-type ligase-like ATP-grasp enzyme